MIPKNRRPTHPGEILLEEFLIPLGLTQVELAARMSVSVQRINTIVNGKRDISAETAVLLSIALGTTAELWMNLQAACDLFDARRSLGSAAA